MSAHSSSSSSKRGKTRTYYKVAANSQIDESLFGAPTREVQRAKMLEDKYRNGSNSPIEVILISLNMFLLYSLNCTF